jgi:hypothetical protein
MYLTAPFSWPVAWVLDKLVGEHKLTRFNPDELSWIFKLHSHDELKKCHYLDSAVSGLNDSQIDLIEGAINSGD